MNKIQANLALKLLYQVSKTFNGNLVLCYANLDTNWITLSGSCQLSARPWNCTVPNFKTFLPAIIFKQCFKFNGVRIYIIIRHGHNISFFSIFKYPQSPYRRHRIFRIQESIHSWTVHYKVVLCPWTMHYMYFIYKLSLKRRVCKCWC